jgi:hypothetical protein
MDAAEAVSPTQARAERALSRVEAFVVRLKPPDCGHGHVNGVAATKPLAFCEDRSSLIGATILVQLRERN